MRNIAYLFVGLVLGGIVFAAMGQVVDREMTQDTYDLLLTAQESVVCANATARGNRSISAEELSLATAVASIGTRTARNLSDAQELGRLVFPIQSSSPLRAAIGDGKGATIALVFGLPWAK